MHLPAITLNPIRMSSRNPKYDMSAPHLPHDLLLVLELHEVVAAVARQVHQHVAAAVRQQPLAAGHRRRVAA
jgi:hypothetical protein